MSGDTLRFMGTNFNLPDFVMYWFFVYRTNELEMVNDTLRKTNQELSFKTELIEQQNKELSKALLDLKNTQAQLLQADKMASLGILTAGVAHEINNPLNYLMGAFIGLSDYFETFGSADNDTTKLLLNSIDVGIERISNIINGLNQFSRKSDTLNEDCDIHSILDNCLGMLQNETKHKIEIKKDLFEKPLVVKGNVGKLHQVFLNVLTNAIQAIPQKGTIKITSTTQEQNAIIEIADNGIGVAKEELKKISDPFYTTKPPGDGTGLGLSITHSIVNEHQGLIEFESEINKGMKVILSLPLKRISNDN